MSIIVKEHPQSQLTGAGNTLHFLGAHIAAFLTENLHQSRKV